MRGTSLKVGSVKMRGSDVVLRLAAGITAIAARDAKRSRGPDVPWTCWGIVSLLDGRRSCCQAALWRWRRRRPGWSGWAAFYAGAFSDAWVGGRCRRPCASVDQSSWPTNFLVL